MSINISFFLFFQLKWNDEMVFFETHHYTHNIIQEELHSTHFLFLYTALTRLRPGRINAYYRNSDAELYWKLLCIGNVKP
jgi:hypothetical protein